MTQITNDPKLTAKVLNTGGVVGLPTETVYGLAARVDNAVAISRVYAIKERPVHHPLIVHAYDIGQCCDWGFMSDAAQTLANTYWPGPLTLLVKRTNRISDQITGGRDTVALRVPNHPMALEVLQGLSVPVVAPSANKFGRVSPTTAHHVLTDLADEVDLILDGGACVIGLESTILDCTTREVQVLRPGFLAAADITLATGIAITPPSGPSRAAGMLEHHYAPLCRVELFETRDQAFEALSLLKLKGTTGEILDYGTDLAAYAHDIYDDLRQCDIKKIKVALCVLPPPIGIGVAIRDRLGKAASSEG